MKVKAIKLFSDASGLHRPGDEYDEVDEVAAVRIEKGLVVSAEELKPEPPKKRRKG